jgi:hypothetical protein
MNSITCPIRTPPNHQVITSPNSVHIDVNPYTGQLTDYSGDYMLPGTPTPGVAPVNLTLVLTKEQAEKIAEDVYPKLIVKSKFTDLMIINDANEISHLTWISVMNSEPDNIEERKYNDKLAAVDAHDGTIVWSL